MACLLYRCHGTDAVGTTLAPNLTDPNAKMPLAEFLKTVKNGNPDKGMQAWDKLLDEKQITQLYDYVRARADKVLPPGRPDEVGPNGGLWVPPAGWSPTKGGEVASTRHLAPGWGTPLPSVMQGTPSPPQPQYRLHTAGGW